MKNRFSKKERVVRSFMMTAIAAGLIAVGAKVSNDYMGGAGHSQKELKVVAAEATPTATTQGAIETTTGTVTPTASPTVDPGTQVKVTVNYKSERIVVEKGDRGSTKFYFSQDKMKTWQFIENGTGSVTMDLAIFMKTSDNTIYFKGDKDEKPYELVIPKEDKGLKITYYVDKGVGKLKIENPSSIQALLYRKGKDGAWQDYNTSMSLKDYEINGFTLQFRVAPSETHRAGKVINVKIPKRQNPPSVKVDYSKFVITGLKKDSTQYRLAGSSQWLDFKPSDNKIKTLSLTELLLSKDTAENLKQIPAGNIEFRTKETDKKTSSGVIMLSTKAQPALPDASKVTLVGTNLTFTDASKDKVYEYLVAHEGDKIELATAKWKKVSNSKTIQIKKVGTATPIPKDVVYYRLAVVKDMKTKEETPASMYGKLEIKAISN